MSAQEPITAHPVVRSGGRPHSLLVPHTRRQGAHGWIGTRPGCLACVEQFGEDYAAKGDA